MNASIKEKINQVNTEQLRFGYSELTGCTEQDIVHFSAWVKELYPEASLLQYIDLMRIANGLNHNGLYVYNIKESDEDSIYYMNEVWQDIEDGKYLFFGTNDISFFAMELSTGVFCILDLPSGSFEEAFASFDEMIDEALRIALS